MDKLYDISVESLWTKIGINTINVFKLDTEFSHLDGTSISVQGEYNYGEESKYCQENIIKINKGYSRDKRPESQSIFAQYNDNK